MPLPDPHLDFLAEWKEAVASAEPEGPFRDLVLRSWSRSRAAGLSADSDSLAVRRVSEHELERRRAREASLLAAATPHLGWISAALGQMMHVVYLVDRDGIVLASEGNDVEAMEQYALTPGHDWSEAVMGSNGAGTALVEGSPVVIFAAEHFIRPLRGFVCAAAPIRDPAGTVIGSLDVSTRVEDGRPTNLLLASQAAFAIERTLGAGPRGYEDPEMEAPPA